MRNIYLTVLTLVFVTSACTPMKNLQVETKYQNREIGIQIILYPNFLYNYSQVYPPDTSYGSWFMQDKNTITFQSKYNSDKLPIVVKENIVNDSAAKYYISIRDINGEKIDLYNKKYIVVLNGLDTIYDITNNEFCIDKNRTDIESLRVGIVIPDPLHYQHAPLNIMLMYEEYFVLSRTTNKFNLFLFYEHYLWDYGDMDSITARITKNKLIFGSNIKFYKK
ncbi:MAG: hypothetical protein V2I47_03040 [Bacteroidales bacterium]|jgi:hypothetical protein|nr:hypothetical protein [Bacteroidales bacterium]